MEKRARGGVAADFECVEPGWEQDGAAGPGPGATPERRASPRMLTLIRPGKLVIDGREFLCVVRDISEGGVKLRLFHAIPEHKFAEIQFDNGETCTVKAMWQDGDLAGFAFVARPDLARLIAAPKGAPRRPPRLNVRLEAVLSAGGLRTPVVVRDLSQRGACIECSGWLMIDELVRLESEALPTLHAKVRWRRPPYYGLVFEQTFRIDDLARVCSELAVEPAAER